MTTEPGTPAGTPAPAWARRFGVGAGIVLLVAVMVVGLAGGFDQRRDWILRAAGEEVDANNLVFTLASATAQRDDTTSRHTWTVLVTGTVRNPHETTLVPITGDYGNLVARDHRGGHVATLSSAELGDHYSRIQVPPDNRPITLVAKFDFDELDAQGTLDVGVTTMEYTDNSVLGLGGGELAWNVDSTVQLQLVTVPLTVLPPKTR